MRSKKSSINHRIISRILPVSASLNPLIESRLSSGVGAADVADKPPPIPPRLIFAADSESRTSTSASVAVQGNGRRQRLQRVFLRCIRSCGIRKPIDTDSKSRSKCFSRRFSAVPSGNSHLTWLMFVAMAYLYNFISIPLRIAFPVWQRGHGHFWAWMCIDYACDVLYLIDSCFVQTRIKYLENGLWVVREGTIDRPDNSVLLCFRLAFV